MNLSLDHLEVALLFSAVSSLVLGIVTKKTDGERLRYGAQRFAYFLIALFGIGWAMRILHG